MKYLLKNPGLVCNDTDDTSCFLACTQMVMRAKNGGSVLSFAEISEIIGRKEGEYSWEYAMLGWLADHGFRVRFISTFDLTKFTENAHDYMHAYFGKEAAEDQISHSNMDVAVAGANAFLAGQDKVIETRVPEREDIEQLIQEGYYLIPYLNQRILQADPGYVAHTVVVYGYSERGVMMHNPGSPAVEAAEIAWDLFIKSWSSPSENARILMAVKPSEAIY